MKYRAVFILRLRHLFYADKRCPNFQIEPTLHTQRLLKNYRCVLEPLPDGILVVTAAGENDEPLIPIPGNVTFAFQLRLLRPDFSMFTELADITSKAAPLFTNAGCPLAAAVTLRLGERIASNSERLILPKGGTSASFRLGGHPMDGCPVNNFILEGLPGGKIENYDPGRREITILAPDHAIADRTFTVAYPVKPQRESGVFADVEIHSNDSMSKPGGGASEFFIRFQAKEGKWRYYLITHRKSASFVIESDRIKFTKLTPDKSDPLAKALQAQYPGFSLVCFESTESFRCQEAVTKHIRLKLETGAGEVETVFENLPNPSIWSICTVQNDFAYYQVVKDIDVFVTQSIENDFAYYQVVKDIGVTVTQSIE